jgi:type II secretory pathway pseudopilin PulG
VTHMEAKSRKACRQGNPESGFSIIELLVVCLMIFVISAMAAIQLQPMWQQIQANASMSQVKTTIRQAREAAISQRRTIIVVFATTATGTPCLPSSGITNCLELFQVLEPANTVALAPYLTIPIENNVSILSFAGAPDTPDAFIGAAPAAPAGIYFGSTAGVPTSGLEFQSDGTFTDGNGNPVNLSLFLGVSTMPTSGRAITILGNTGRVSAYHGTGQAWFK